MSIISKTFMYIYVNLYFNTSIEINYVLSL